MSSPLEHQIWQRVTRARRRWMDANGEQAAAALAYYLLVSLLPFLIILVAAGSLFFARDVVAQSVMQLINGFTPLTVEQERAGETAIRGILDRHDAINITAFVLMTIGALQFLRTLIRTTNRIWRSAPYSWWRLPLKSLSLLGVATTVMIVGILLPQAAHWMQPWLALFGGLTAIYRLAPSRITTFAEVWLGALIATGTIGIGELLFHAYAVNIGHFSAYYGVLGGIVAFLFWVLVASGACVGGVCLCAASVEIGGGAASSTSLQEST